MSRALTTQTRRDPFALARSLFGFDPFFDMETRAESSQFIPSFDIKETQDGYVLSADVPGVTRDNLDISLQRNTLTVSGSRMSEQRNQEDTYYVYERRFGSFARSFTLPDAADGEAVNAKLENGVLMIHVAKKAESKPKKILIGK